MLRDNNIREQKVSVQVGGERSIDGNDAAGRVDEVPRGTVPSPTTDAQGRCNRVKRGPKKRKGRYHGVCYHRTARKWVAVIAVCNQQKYLGLHEKAETAARVYDSWARRLHGAKAVLNFP